MGTFGRLILGVLLLCLMALAGGAGYFYYQLTPPAIAVKETLYLVKSGQTLYGVSQDLGQKKLLRNPQAFRLLARLQGKSTQLHTGFYRFDGRRSASAILDALTEGKTVKIPFTIPEGYSNKKAAVGLNKYGLSEEKYIAAAENPSPDLISHYSFLKGTSGEQSLEGYLYPDTYHLAGSVEELQEAQLHRFQELVMPLWERRPASHTLSFSDTIKLASVVELEGLLDRELPTIAGVFLKRLKIGMKLESDPTTEYAQGWHQGNTPLSLKDIQIDSPYNTYRYHGLMPTPIGNPGKVAIEAVLFPKQTDYLYFVARGDGSHTFSKTYQEHLAAIRKIYYGK